MQKIVVSCILQIPYINLIAKTNCPKKNLYAGLVSENNFKKKTQQFYTLPGYLFINLLFLKLNTVNTHLKLLFKTKDLKLFASLVSR
jgi:hypothetical protein